MTNKALKNKILDEFNTMKAMEQDAYEFYIKASKDSIITEQTTKNSLLRIAEDEKKHVELVDKIINIVQYCL